MVPQGITGRQRFASKDIEGGACKPPAIELGNQVGLDHQRTARDIDQPALRLQPVQGGGIDQVFSIGRMRREQDQHAACRKEGRPCTRAVHHLDAFNRLGRSRKAAHGKAGTRQVRADLRAEHADADNADR